MIIALRKGDWSKILQLPCGQWSRSNCKSNRNQQDDFATLLWEWEHDCWSFQACYSTIKMYKNKDSMLFVSAWKVMKIILQRFFKSLKL